LPFLDDELRARPLFWAGLVPTGNLEPIDIDKSFWDYINNWKDAFWYWLDK